MSAQFGRLSLTGDRISPDYLKKVDTVLAPYGPDGSNCFNEDGISILYRAFHTTKEAHTESQPLVSPLGAIITWDGRLDNRVELIRILASKSRNGSSDVSIVAAAYEQWGVKCFRRLVGDWALAIWDPHSHSIVLAKDFVGTRHLYYSFDHEQITWSSVLDPLVLSEGRAFPICEEYLAGWLGSFPAAHLTPYVGIHSVPPSCFVQFRAGKCRTEKYWDFNSSRSIRYHNGAEYEEHFRTAFSEAVSRRLRADCPILAELSGGMDSSAIVCVADEIMRGASNVPRVDTISYYDDSEPNWNERPYFTKVEEKRGRTGHHIDVSSQGSFVFDFESDQFIPTPASVVRTTERAKQFAAWMTSQAARVLLSGVGGDEVMGGVPTPLPELEDHLVRLQIRALAHSLKVWSLDKRKPWFHLLLETAQRFFPPSFLPPPKCRRPPAWLSRGFVRRNLAALQGYEERLKILGPRPSFQDNLATLDGLRRQLGCSAPNPSVVYETRYPYLDRDLLEFLYAIPRTQLVRPGQRRSLMRRALVGIVPVEVLERRRKAFVSRSPLKKIGTYWAEFAELGRDTNQISRKILDANSLSEVMKRARKGEDVPIPMLMRTLSIQAWLKGIDHYGVCKRASP